MGEIDSHRLARPTTKVQALLPPLFLDQVFMSMIFTQLKRTYPISTTERECGAYKYLMENSTEEERVSWGISTNELKKTILPDEKYIYQAGLEDGEFRTMCSSFDNFALVRKYIFGIKD